MDSKREKLALVSDIPLDRPLKVKDLNNREIALFNIDGIIYALDDACPHEGASLGAGEMKEGCVSCPLHGWTFEVSTGNCINMPGVDAEKIELAVEEGVVYLKN